MIFSKDIFCILEKENNLTGFLEKKRGVTGQLSTSFSSLIGTIVLSTKYRFTTYNK